MAEEGVFHEVTSGVKAHPFLIVGGVVAAVLVLVVFSRSKAPAVQQFSYQSGPSDAAIAANASMVNTQVNASEASSIASDYFQYLATNSATQAQVQLGTAGYAAAAVQDHDATAAAIAANQAASNVSIAGIGYMTTTTTAKYAADTQQQQQALAAQTAQQQIGSNERVADNQLYDNYNLASALNEQNYSLGVMAGQNQLNQTYYTGTNALNQTANAASTAQAQIASNERVAANNTGTQYLEWLHQFYNV